jgi:WD40 repeat protein
VKVELTDAPVTPFVLSVRLRFATGVVGEPFATYGVRVYDWPRRKAPPTFLGHIGPVTALRFRPDGKSLASGAQDTSVLLWDLSKIPEGK